MTPDSHRAPSRRLTTRWSSLSWRLAMLIISLLAVSAVVTAVYAAATVRTNAEEANTESMRNVHLSVAQTLEQSGADVRRYEENELANRKGLLRDLTNAQLAMLSQLAASVDRGEMNLEAAQSAAERTLFNFRYGIDDYFFAFTPEMVSIVEPNPTFRGDMIDYRDANGKAFFREFQQVALGPGAGFVDYVGTRVGATEPAAKTSYVAYFAPWAWVIGTGVYLDDIEAEAATRRAQSIDDLNAALDGVRFAESGFFFVIDGEGALVAGPTNRQAADLADSADGQRLAAELIAAASEPGPQPIAVSADASLDGTSQRWLFGVSEVQPMDWILVSAVPEAQLTSTANRLALRQTVLIAVVLAIGLAIGLLTSRRIVRPVQDLTTAAVALEEGSFSSASLDDAAGRKDEVGGLARAFQRMAVEVVERERALRERVSRLEVVIDRAKVDQDVSTIAGTDFFADLERQAAELRRQGRPGGEADSAPADNESS